LVDGTIAQDDCCENPDCTTINVNRSNQVNLITPSRREGGKGNGLRFIIQRGFNEKIIWLNNH
jgi:hypothetical protein